MKERRSILLVKEPLSKIYTVQQLVNLTAPEVGTKMTHQKVVELYDSTPKDVTITIRSGK